MLSLIKPAWPAPANVKAFSTTRKGGVSEAPYHGLNLGLHVGDSSEKVEQNRAFLLEELRQQGATANANIQWLEQTHSTTVVRHQNADADLVLDADACYSQSEQHICAVMTADCLPILLCNQAGDWVAAIHAGWRGLLDGVVENTLQCYQGDSPLMAWIGPAISQAFFEVGAEVKQLFCDKNPENESFFMTSTKTDRTDKFLCSLAEIAQVLLESYGVKVYLSDECSFADAAHYYSYRRDGVTGRMASLIWLDEKP